MSTTTTTGNSNGEPVDHHHQLLKISLAFGAVSLVFGWQLHKWTSRTSRSSSWKDWLTLRHKLVLVICGENASKLFSKATTTSTAGQMAAHCASASILAFQTASQCTPLSTLIWHLTGQTKVVVRTQSVFEFTKLAEEASKRSLASSLIKEDTSTTTTNSSKPPKAAAVVLAIGPGPASLVDQVTGHLKLLR